MSKPTGEECKHDYDNPVRKGRANLRCPKCDKDITLELVLIHEAIATPLPKEEEYGEKEFLTEVWEALKGDHNDLRRERIILQAFRKISASQRNKILQEVVEEIEVYKYPVYTGSAAQIRAWQDAYNAGLSKAQEIIRGK